MGKLPQGRIRMSKAYVMGMAMTKFTRNPKLRVEKMGAMAVREAIHAARISLKDIQEVYCGNVFNGSGIGQKVMTEAGFIGMPRGRVSSPPRP